MINATERDETTQNKTTNLNIGFSLHKMFPSLAVTLVLLILALKQLNVFSFVASIFRFSNTTLSMTFNPGRLHAGCIMKAVCYYTLKYCDLTTMK